MVYVGLQSRRHGVLVRCCVSVVDRERVSVSVINRRDECCRCCRGVCPLCVHSAAADERSSRTDQTDRPLCGSVSRDTTASSSPAAMFVCCRLAVWRVSSCLRQHSTSATPLCPPADSHQPNHCGHHGSGWTSNFAPPPQKITLLNLCGYIGFFLNYSLCVPLGYSDVAYISTVIIYLVTASFQYRETYFQ